LICVKRGVLTVGLRNLRPQVLGTRVAAIAHVKGNDLAGLGIHGDPHPLLVGFLLHKAGEFIGFHLKPLYQHIVGTGDGLDMEMIGQGLEAMNYPAASCEVSNPRWRTAMAPPVWRGDCSCGMCTLEQPQLDVLAMQLRIAFVTALLPHILANDCFIPVTAYRTDEIAFGPELTSPQTLFDGRDALKDLTSREAFDDLDNLGRAIARYRLHQKMDMIFVGTNL
jgi:hypothetical protein